MFTGIIEAIGNVAALEIRRGGARIVIEAALARQLAVGESVAVNGCCLTAIASPRGALESDLSPETLSRTAFGGVKPGARVNLERALRADARLSGHVVQGHVDAVLTLVSSRPEGDGLRQRYGITGEIAPFVAAKGSLAIDGVSLTVAALARDWLEVALVPHTLATTTLPDRKPGDRVNVETDVLARHVVQALSHAGAIRREAPEIARFSTGAPWESEVGYCRAVRVGRRILVSGTAPVEPDGSTHAPGDARAQAARCIEIILRAVRELGGPGAVIVRTRLFVTDISRWAQFAAAHAAAFGANPPVTTMVEVARLIAPDMLVEIEAEADAPDSR